MKFRTVTACLIAALAFSVPLSAQEPAGPGFKVLYNFPFFAPFGLEGTWPVSALVRDREGNLYGTTFTGGQPTRPGRGVVFKLDPQGNETVLYAFTGGTDGGAPQAGVIRDEDGNLYGTTSLGVEDACGGGCGVVFKLSPDGQETVLYAFKGVPDGSHPGGNLIRDAEGNFYGTVPAGGNLGNGCVGGCGVVFKLDPWGNETVLYEFSGGADGAVPNGNLIRDDAGKLYGTTGSGGSQGDGGSSR